MCLSESESDTLLPKLTPTQVIQELETIYFSPVIAACCVREHSRKE